MPRNEAGSTRARNDNLTYSEHNLKVTRVSSRHSVTQQIENSGKFPWVMSQEFSRTGVDSLTYFGRNLAG